MPARSFGWRIPLRGNPSRRAHLRSRSLSFEPLEDRRVMAIDLISSALAGPSSTGNNSSSSSAISTDGRYVAFQSSATNLVAGDAAGFMDVFVKDTQTGIIRCVSTSVTGDLGDSDSYNPSLSADGRYVAFESYASNLVPNDVNGFSDLFVKDLQTGTITLASTSSAGIQGDFYSYNGSLSGDGRYLAFESYASNLVLDDTNGNLDVFVKDLQTGAIILASASSTGVQGNSASNNPVLSADGRFVAFESDADNLIAADTNLSIDVFVKNLETGEVVCAGTNAAGELGDQGSGYPSLSGDGHYVAFHSSSTNLVLGDSNNFLDVFVRDLQAGTISRVSTTTAGGEGNSASYYPSLSADGRYLSFESYADNLVPGDTNSTIDIFVKDTQTGRISRISTTAAGGEANSCSSTSALSADALFVAFTSLADNLVADDLNVATDVFRSSVVLAPPPGLNVILSAAGNLTIQDTDPTGKDDTITARIFNDGTTHFLEITDDAQKIVGLPNTTPASTLTNSDHTVRIPLAAITGTVTLDGGLGSNSLTLDFVNGLLSVGLFNGGGATAIQKLQLVGAITASLTALASQMNSVSAIQLDPASASTLQSITAANVQALAGATGGLRLTVNAQTSALPVHSLQFSNEWVYNSLVERDGTQFHRLLAGTVELLVENGRLQNPLRANDASGGGGITALDALLVINVINKDGTGAFSLSRPSQASSVLLLIDIDGNGNLTPLDALIIINYINAGGTPFGEAGSRMTSGEASSAEAAPVDALLHDEQFHSDLFWLDDLLPSLTSDAKARTRR